MFNIFKRRKKDKPSVGKIQKDEYAEPTKQVKTEQNDAKLSFDIKIPAGNFTVTAKTTSDKDKSFDNLTNLSQASDETKVLKSSNFEEKTLEEKAIDMIKHSALNKYYVLLENSVGGKTSKELADGIDKKIMQLLDNCGILVDGQEDTATKIAYAQKMFDYIVNNIKYDDVLTKFMRIANEKIYHENINKEILKEMYYELCNYSGTCLSDSCILAYIFEKIGLNASVIGLGNHAMVEVDFGDKKLYCDSVYERDIVDGLDKNAIAQGKGKGSGFMKDSSLMTERGYHKEFNFPKISTLLLANRIDEEFER